MSRIVEGVSGEEARSKPFFVFDVLCDESGYAGEGKKGRKKEIRKSTA